MHLKLLNSLSISSHHIVLKNLIGYHQSWICINRPRPFQPFHYHIVFFSYFCYK